MSSDTGTAVIALIANIPQHFTAADLRVHFSDAVEKGAFTVFHYQRRKEHEDAATCCCMVKVAAKELPHVLRVYHNRRFTDRKGDVAEYYCDISPAACSHDGKVELPAAVRTFPGRRYQTLADRKSMEEKQVYYWRGEKRSLPSSSSLQRDETASGQSGTSQATTNTVPIASLKEFHTPPYLPQGNVGTPAKVILGLIKSCRLPTVALKRLDLDFSLLKNPKRYGAVPYSYEEEGGTAAAMAATNASASAHHSSSTAAPLPGLREEGNAMTAPAASAKRQRISPLPAPSQAAAAVRPEPSIDEKLSEGLEERRAAYQGDDDELQEWERHEVWHSDDMRRHTFRTHTTEREEYLVRAGTSLAVLLLLSS